MHHKFRCVNLTDKVENMKRNSNDTHTPLTVRSEHCDSMNRHKHYIHESLDPKSTRTTLFDRSKSPQYTQNCSWRHETPKMLLDNHPPLTENLGRKPQELGLNITIAAWTLRWNEARTIFRLLVSINILQSPAVNVGPASIKSSCLPAIITTLNNVVFSAIGYFMSPLLGLG